MIRVGLDISGLDLQFKSHAMRGIGRYVSELQRHLLGTSSGDITVSSFEHRALTDGGLAASFVKALPFGRQTLKQQLLYPLKLNSGAMRELSFVHFPAHMDAPAWSRMPFVLTVLDLIPLVLEPLYRVNKSTARFKFARWLELTSIRAATILLAISENTANDLVKVLGIERDRIVVTPLGVDPSFFEIYEKRRSLSNEKGAELRKKLHLPPERPVILYVGGHDQRKNISSMMKILSGVLTEYSVDSPERPVLCLAGRVSGEEERTRLDAAIAENRVEPDVIELGFVSDADLHELYKISSLFLFTSLYEGFGLPVLEAMAAGLPVVSASTSSIPEVLGDTGVLFEPDQLGNAVDGIKQLLRDSSIGNNFAVAAQARAQKFTWDATARATLEGYSLAAKRLKLSSNGAR